MNKDFMNAIYKRNTIDKVTFADFEAVCNQLDLPVVEVLETVNDKVEPYKTKRINRYYSIFDFRKTLPDSTIRDVYNRKGLSDYKNIPDIISGNGKFSLNETPMSGVEHSWDFIVTDFCVLVHTITIFETDKLEIALHK